MVYYLYLKLGKNPRTTKPNCYLWLEVSNHLTDTVRLLSLHGIKDNQLRVFSSNMTKMLI